MVYQGKPSAGCANCRKRKIKCDEVRPACSQCINTKRTCPGYLARFDLILRDQTKAVRRKAQRPKQNAATSPRADQQTTTSGLQAVGPNNAFEAINPELARLDTQSVSMMAPIEHAHTLTSGTTGRLVTSSASIPRIFNDFCEHEAICAFFLDFVLFPRHPESHRGHLDHLAPLYEKAIPNSPLALATSAIALAIAGHRTVNPMEVDHGRTVFGKALRKTSAAIRDPADSVKDETLMAVLLLGLFERINATLAFTSTSTATTNGSHQAETTPSDALSDQTLLKSGNMTSAHNAGAAALVKHRGKKNCASPLAIGLLFAVRTQLVENSIEEGEEFKRCPDDLSAVFAALPQNAAARLTSATLNIADLRSCAKTALKLHRTKAAESEVNDLLEYAISIDLLVAAWAETVPPEWQWISGTSFQLPLTSTIGTDPHASNTFRYSPTHQDVYLDLWVMSIWNQYRAARLKIQTIILSCISYLGQGYEERWYWRGVYAKMVSQQMSDEICASIPFGLGTKTSGGPGVDASDVEYPFVSEGVKSDLSPKTNVQTTVSLSLTGESTGLVKSAQSNVRLGKQSDEHRRAASALGGWHLLDPLRTIVRAEEAEIGVLRKGQVDWCRQQMRRIGRIYRLNGTASPLDAGNIWERSPV